MVRLHLSAHAPVNGCLVRDTYSPSVKHPEGLVTDEGLLTSQRAWTGTQINGGWRRRWALENTFGQMTTCWGLGEWQVGVYEVYRTLILLMALTYGVLQAYLQREARWLVRTGDACVIVGPEQLNEWIARGLLGPRGP